MGATQVSCQPNIHASSVAAALAVLRLTDHLSDPNQHSIFDDIVADLEAKNLAKDKPEGLREVQKKC